MRYTPKNTYFLCNSHNHYVMPQTGIVIDWERMNMQNPANLEFARSNPIFMRSTPRFAQTNPFVVSIPFLLRDQTQFL